MKRWSVLFLIFSLIGLSAFSVPGFAHLQAEMPESPNYPQYLRLMKVDQDSGLPQAGAEFYFSLDEAGEEKVKIDEMDHFISDETGLIARLSSDLDYDSLYLHETKAPQGYVLLERPVLIEIPDSLDAEQMSKRIPDIVKALQELVDDQMITQEQMDYFLDPLEKPLEDEEFLSILQVILETYNTIELRLPNQVIPVETPTEPGTPTEPKDPSEPLPGTGAGSNIGFIALAVVIIGLGIYFIRNKKVGSRFLALLLVLSMLIVPMDSRAETIDPSGRLFVYQNSEYISGDHPLYRTASKIFTGVTWDQSISGYCLDGLIINENDELEHELISFDEYMTRAELEFSPEEIELLQAIMAQSYPQRSVEEIRRLAQTQATDEEIIQAAQLAIWTITNELEFLEEAGRYFISYPDLTPEWSWLSLTYSDKEVITDAVYQLAQWYLELEPVVSFPPLMELSIGSSDRPISVEELRQSARVFAIMNGKKLKSGSGKTGMISWLSVSYHSMTVSMRCCRMRQSIKMNTNAGRPR